MSDKPKPLLRYEMQGFQTLGWIVHAAQLMGTQPQLLANQRLGKNVAMHLRHIDVYDVSDTCQSGLQVREEPPWQQLATATHMAQQPAQDPATAKPHIEAWDQALQKNELQLLQLHIAATLQTPCQFCASVLNDELVLMLCA